MQVAAKVGQMTGRNKCALVYGSDALASGMVKMKKTKSVWSKLGTACLIGVAICLVATVIYACFDEWFNPARAPFLGRLAVGFGMLFCAMAAGVCFFGCLDLGYARQAVKSGRGWVRFRKIDRNIEPFAFWWRVVLFGIAMVGTFILGIMELLGCLEWN